MTNAEKLDWLYRLKSEIYVYMPKEWLIPMGNALDLAIKALEQTEWIPVSKRDPEEYGEYFITWTTPFFDHPLVAICEGEVTSVWDEEKNQWKFEWLLADYIKAYPDARVTAWRPLPEPYKED